ncbi:hypothetical protein NA56DRAFT_314854 [Hyaloscypha hepaticicola]|uniref:Uncharacterized protein n=1 Tax=Hyaloscypha hepaticicola TaxID=2082293 RepID=A0A2J6PQP4_9HELO|nr:hypothetical protein NA56DRAFT_314854 [Hyaloscypha hepaticicola]
MQAASKVQLSMDNLKFALILTFSILSSSIATILVVYLLLCLRRRRQERQERKREEFKQKIDIKRGSDKSSMPSLSEFPLPANRKVWNDTGMGSSIGRGRPSSEAVPRWTVNSSQGRRSVELPFPGAGNSCKTWSQDPTAVDGGETINGRRRRMTEGEAQRSRANGSIRTLTYDADFPDQPPRFGSWLGEFKRTRVRLTLRRGVVALE